MKLPIHIALDATGATLFDADAAPDAVSISTDTRTLQPGDTFVALRGEHYNGHDCVAQAVAQGAAMVVIDEPQVRVDGVAAMLVERTKLALMGLAHAARGCFAGHVIAITGSAGKTTTKVFLAQLLEVRYAGRVRVAPANENNEIGVAKLLLGASNEEHDAIVVEMGARYPGDIDALVEIAEPHVGILTNVGDAHLEIMGSRELLEETKWGLFSQGAYAVLNLDDAASRARAPGLAVAPHWFAARETDEGLSEGDYVTAAIGSRIVDVVEGVARSYESGLCVPGAHNRANAAAALAGAMEVGIPLEVMLPLLGALKLPEGRFEAIEAGGLHLIYDAYNANASGTIASLDAFAGVAGARHIAVFGSMAELGDESEVLHERVGAHAATKVDVLLVGGEFAEALARGAAGAGLSSERIVRFAANADAASWLRANARPEDVVLLKGSRKYKLEEIVEELRAT